MGLRTNINTLPPPAAVRVSQGDLSQGRKPDNSTFPTRFSAIVGLSPTLWKLRARRQFNFPASNQALLMSTTAGWGVGVTPQEAASPPSGISALPLPTSRGHEALCLEDRAWYQPRQEKREAAFWQELLGTAPNRASLPFPPCADLLSRRLFCGPPEVPKTTRQAETQVNQKQVLLHYQILNPCSSQWMKGKPSPT